jgi:hypothetical protein
MPGDMTAAYAGLSSKRNADEAGTEISTKQKRVKVEQQEGDLGEPMAEKVSGPE